VSSLLESLEVEQSMAESEVVSLAESELEEVSEVRQSKLDVECVAVEPMEPSNSPLLDSKVGDGRI
jgi:hypothetical protein